MSHDHDFPLCRLGQGTSTRDINESGYWHEPHTPPHDARTVRVWIAGDNTYHRGFHACNMWVIYDRNANPVHVEDDTVIGWQDIPAPPAVVPPVRSNAVELACVGAGVVAIMAASWIWSPLIGAGAAALAVVFAVACWVGGVR